MCFFTLKKMLYKRDREKEKCSHFCAPCNAYLHSLLCQKCTSSQAIRPHATDTEVAARERGDT